MGQSAVLFITPASTTRIGAAVLFGVLWWMLSGHWRPGMLFAVWVTWYGLQRFLVDFTRIGNEMDRMAGPLTWCQWVGLAASLAALGWLIWRLMGVSDRSESALSK